MDKRWNKTVFRAILLLTFIGLNTLLLFGIASVLRYVNSGADRSKMLHLSAELDAAYRPHMQWGTLQNEGRPMEEQTLKDISKDYRNAWYFRNRALELNTLSGLEDYFTAKARKSLEPYIVRNRNQNSHLESSTIAHHLQLQFYSSDGKIVSFRDMHVRAYEKVFQHGKLQYANEKTRSYHIVMLLEDGFWRIRQMVEVPRPKLAKARIPQRTTKAIESIKGINYYPQQYPWALFEAKRELVLADLKQIKAMGLNSVRIFVPYHEFGADQVIPEKLAALVQFLDLAHQEDLGVLVTLFDFYGDYSLADWTLTHRHTESIVSAVHAHPAIMAWDIKNEADLDFDARGKQNVLAWLSEMQQQIRAWDPIHPITIGWSSSDVADTLKDKLDFISFHYYKDPEEFPRALGALQAKVGQKPILLQEYGNSSYGGVWNLFSGSEEEQATYYKKMQKHLKQKDLPFMSWTLYDFERVPTSVAGCLPWRKMPQKNYGLIDKEGNKKSAYTKLVRESMDK